MSITLYGISNCDTVKKARAWLAEEGVEYTFHDFRKQGLPADRVEAWLREIGWEKLLNRKGTTWRKLDAAAQSGITDATSARALMLAQPSIIRRPVIEWGRQTTVGFDPDAYRAVVAGP
jgi:Spx/MgsR family transcriptional regulator